jgi:hypothetical protein
LAYLDAKADAKARENSNNNSRSLRGDKQKGNSRGKDNSKSKYGEMIIKIDPADGMERCEYERLRFPLAFSACLQTAVS